MKNNFKTFPDSRKFEPKDRDEGEFDYNGYIVAISTWFSDFKKEVKQEYIFAREQAKNPLLTHVFGELLGLKELDLEIPVQNTSHEEAKP